MAVRQFGIRSDGQAITGIGLRAEIYMIAYKYSLRVVPQNISKELVRVVASGEENSMESFYKDLLDYCTSTLRLKSENITKMENYDGLEPEWTHYESLFSGEQTAKGISYLQLTYEKLNQIDAKFGIIGEGVRLSNEQLKRLDSLPEIEKTLEKLTSILEKIAPTLEALSRGARGDLQGRSGEENKGQL